MIDKEIERTGVTKILNLLNKYDLNELVLTVTNRMISNFKEDECIPLILNYSPDALHFLKKKKIKKELIFRYLNEEHVYVKSWSTKSELIRECLKYWGSAETCESMEIEEIESEEDDDVIVCNQISESSMNNQISREPEFINQQVIHQQHLINNQISTPINNLMTHPTNQIFNPPYSQQLNQADTQLIELSIKFGEWFYSTLPQINVGGFDVNNFWPESQLRLMFECNSTSVGLSESESGQNVNLLKQLVSSKLKFKPNLLPQFDGVRTQVESHGLLKVVISGILYYDEHPVGWFDHMFGLIPDSRLNQHNWRIKCLDMLNKLSKPLPCIEQFINSYHQIKNC